MEYTKRNENPAMVGKLKTWKTCPAKFINVNTNDKERSGWNMLNEKCKVLNYIFDF